MAKGRPNPRRANGTRRNALVARVKALGEPCWICGCPIDRTLPAGHPLAFEVDELVPVSKGGSPYLIDNCKASHRACNQWRSVKSVEYVGRVKAAVLEMFGPWRNPLEFVHNARIVCRSPKAVPSGTEVRHPKKSSGVL